MRGNTARGGSWSCGACTLDNEPEKNFCGACGRARVPARASRAAAARAALLTVVSSNGFDTAVGDKTAWQSAWPGAQPAPLRLWVCTFCAKTNGYIHSTCHGCGGAQPYAEPTRCIACSTARACPQHVATRLRRSPGDAETRAVSLAEEWFDELDRAGLRPLDEGDAASDADDDDDDGSLADAVRRCALGAAARNAPRGPEPTVDEVRRMYGIEPEPSPYLVFDTIWEEGRNPRRRIELLVAAGCACAPATSSISWLTWFADTLVSRKNHSASSNTLSKFQELIANPTSKFFFSVKWARTLWNGHRQVVTFSTTGGMRHWDYESAALGSLDSDALHIMSRRV